MKRHFFPVVLCFAFCTSFSQSNNEEYNKLFKSTKKANIPHFKIDLGVGVGSMDNFVQKTNYLFYFNPPQRSIDSSFESTTLLYLTASLDIDLIETRRVYFNFGGAYTYGFYPGTGKSKVEGVEDTKASDKLNLCEAHIKLGYGAESFKVYAQGGMERYDFKHTYYLKTNILGSETESWDTGYVKQIYPMVGLGIRIGNNRKKFCFDFSVYKLLPRDEFFNWTQKPDITKEIESLGKYKTIYPSLPIGFSMSLQRHGKYEVRVDYRKIRERDFYAKNAQSFMATFSKQFDFYNKKKK